MGKLDVVLAVLAALVSALTAVATLTGDVALWACLTRLGDEELYLVLVILAYYLAPSTVTGFSILIAVLLSGSLNVALKYTLNAPRPLNPLVEVEGPGFPSGHAQVSTAFWSALVLARRRRGLFVLSTAVVVAVSLSRVYLRAHYAIDVLGGVLLGLLTGISPGALLSARVRAGLALRSYVLVATALILGVYNTLYLNVEPGSACALLGLSIATLLVPSTYFYHGYPLNFASVSFARRLAGFAVSAILLAFVHYVLPGGLSALRVLGFAAGGAASFVLIPALLVKWKGG
ncbi:MAG: phosphatase PAP2 family protein [Desulfurococcaceae archaeon]